MFFALTKLSKIRYSKDDSILKEAKLNIISLLWGVLIVTSMILIPYQVWVITGGSNYWDGVYIFLGTGLLSILISFIFYNKVAAKYN